MFPESGKLKKVLLERTGTDGLEVKDTDVKGLLVHQILMRDNDCGVSKTNIAAQANGGAGVVVKFAHMSSRTYKHFQYLAQEIVKPGSAVQNALLKESFIGEAHFKNVVSQATKLSKTLRSRCESGALTLDADLRDRLEGKKVGKEACALAEPPPAAEGTVDSHGIELVEIVKPANP